MKTPKMKKRIALLVTTSALVGTFSLAVFATEGDVVRNQLPSDPTVVITAEEQARWDDAHAQLAACNTLEEKAQVAADLGLTYHFKIEDDIYNPEQVDKASAKFAEYGIPFSYEIVDNYDSGRDTYDSVFIVDFEN